MNPKVLFIHGLASCGSGRKADALANFFGRENLIAPDLPIEPDAAVAKLEGILEAFDVDLLVGSSLGGFYAVRLNHRHKIPAVLVNPAVRPWVSLAPHLGTQRNWCSGEPFELTRDHLARMRDLARNPDVRTESYLVLLARDDAVLDHREAARSFDEFDVRITPSGDHRFRDFSAFLPEVADFRERHRDTA